MGQELFVMRAVSSQLHKSGVIQLEQSLLTAAVPGA